MKQPEIILTEDGSHSLYSGYFNEDYHSKYGAINESKHVFIHSGFSRMDFKREINILEIGFGTGLNALLTLLESVEKKTKIQYHTIEAYPINAEISAHLNYAEILKNRLADIYFSRLHDAAWDNPVVINEFFTIKKLNEKLEDIVLPYDYYDLVYFDAFSPEVQPELWTIEIFKKISSAMKSKGVLVTYSAKGEVRRNLNSAGFLTERLKGPKGKREMIRAVKIST
jgi:tRNA U34 5-methylaminomethyl-2-thiouridine-forming methyltransferase MnmC